MEITFCLNLGIDGAVYKCRRNDWPRDEADNYFPQQRVHQLITRYARARSESEKPPGYVRIMLFAA
ncbi:MAG: hypothetical protein D6820_04685 [Lentisphaerae bacterium]|nr:MAG: hypothetical protein D6820_04685 [Lentisphaerota bacterium]